MVRLTNLFRHVVGLELDAWSPWIAKAGHGFRTALHALAQQRQPTLSKYPSYTSFRAAAPVARMQRNGITSHQARRRRHCTDANRTTRGVDSRGRIKKEYRRSSSSLNSGTSRSSQTRKVQPEACTQTSEEMCVENADTADQDEVTNDNYALRTRANLYREYQSACRDLEEYHDPKSYPWKQYLHLHGQDPGIPGWNGQWTQEDLDLAHLQHGMRLSTASRRAQQKLDAVVQLCGAWDVAPMDWQDQDFPREGSQDDLEGEVQDALDFAPRDAVQDWLNSVPSNAAEFLGFDKVRQPQRQADSVTGMYTVEYLDHLDMPMDWSRDVQTFDSWSCAKAGSTASDKEARRIKEVQRIQQQRPPSWTWNEGFSDRIVPDNSKVLTSHMC